MPLFGLHDVSPVTVGHDVPGKRRDHMHSRGWWHPISLFPSGVVRSWTWFRKLRSISAWARAHLPQQRALSQRGDPSPKASSPLSASTHSWTPLGHAGIGAWDTLARTTVPSHPLQAGRGCRRVWESLPAVPSWAPALLPAGPRPLEGGALSCGLNLQSGAGAWECPRPVPPSAPLLSGDLL